MQVESNIGIIAKVAMKYWIRLPEAVRAWYHLEDMIEDCVMHVLEVKHSYKPSRAKQSTFICTVSINHCKQIIESHMQKKRAAHVVSLEADVMLSTTLSAKIASSEKRMAAKEGVEVLLERSSRDLRHVLSAAMAGQYVPSADVKQVQAEARKLAQEHKVTVSDILFCIQRMGCQDYGF